MAKVYTIHCPNCGLELGKFTVKGGSPKVHCTGCDVVIYIGVADRKDAAITLQYPLTITDGTEVRLPA